MARADDTELIDTFEEFYRSYYRNEIAQLAQKYPNEQKSLYIDWQDLYRFDSDLADDFRNKPNQLREYAEEALRLYDLPVDVSLGQAHVRVRNLPETTGIREIRADHRGMLIAAQGIVRKATDVRPKITNAAFECQRCGTLTRIPQQGGDFQEPHECQGCERQGPFRINFDQSEFIDAQKLRVQESPEGLRGGETPQSIDVNIEDDITGEVTPGDHVTATGILQLEQQGNDREKSAMFDVYMDGLSVEVEDEQFEEMDITEEDKKEIIELSNQPNIYEEMIGAIAPSIYGYEKEKQAMVFQLFSGVTKFLPDGSRTRGDLHILMVGDPGTGKCLKGDTNVTLADGQRRQIGDFVEENLDDPKPVDDGVYDTVDIPVPSLTDDGHIETRRATKVWKREAPDQMYQVTTGRGRTIEVTPSHPLFVQSDGEFVPRQAEDLSAGDEVAVSPERNALTDGGCAVQSGDATVECSLLGQTAHSDRIVSIETTEPDYDWVYDLEVEDTHNYISEGIVSHNSQLLQYIKNIAPRSVYTSGKGSSSAGLCVTGDTLIHTADGIKEISTIVKNEIPSQVEEQTAVESQIALSTFNRTLGSIERRNSSLLWRMPKKPCRRIETERGKQLEASRNTPLLTCGEEGIQWKEISEITSGDHVAIPKYDHHSPQCEPVETREFIELTEEKVKLTDQSLRMLRDQLTEEFGTLRDAAAALELTEDFIYDTLSNRHVPLNKLDRVLSAVELSREDLSFERVMLRHGDSITVPREFDADFMYLLGLVFGDGDIRLDRRDGNRGCVRISNSNEKLLQRAIGIVADKFDKDISIEYQEDKVPCIRIHSATIARLFANAGMETPKESLSLHPKLTTAAHTDSFLRGFMDADGAVSVRDEGGSSVLFSTISQKLARQLQHMLETYGVYARRRERDRRGTYELDNGYTIESKHIQHFVEIYGADIDQYAELIGFGIEEKQRQLEQIVEKTHRRQEKIPVSGALATATGAAGEFHNNIVRGDNPGRERASRILETVELGAVQSQVEEAVEANLRWDQVTEAENTGKKEVFDLTVPETHNFVGNGIVTHNTAAAVRDDFGEGQQWTLEAGALVLADQGIAAVDELDKMRCVTGDTLVHTADGITPIRELAETAKRSGEIEQLPNGKTIRDVDPVVWTMTEAGTIEKRDVTAIHEYDAPESLREITLESGESVTATADHPFFVFSDGERTTKPAEELQDGDWTFVPDSIPPAATDGGLAAESRDCSGPSTTPDNDIALRQVTGIESVPRSTLPEESPSVYDLTVSETHNFVANNIIIHNSEDQSAMHEALEQQSISVSKAGINATLKSRCSLLGAANPTYGRFDEYEPIGEQIDLAPPLISRFDLIFTVTDQPDAEKDAELAEHILQTNYAGELNTHRTETSTSNYTKEEVERITDDVAPTIEPDFLRKYVAYAQRNCYPTMTEDAKSAIQEYYVDLRATGDDEDAPVPVTARKLEALVRLSEASARVRLSDTVEETDAQRAIEIAQYCLEDIGLDPETGELDADMIETGTSKSQRDRIKNIKQLIATIEEEYDEGAPVDVIIERAEEEGMETNKAEHEIDKLKQKGEVYEPQQNHLRTT